MSLLSRIKLAITLIWGGDIVIMVDVYVALIIAGRRTLEQVPATIQPQVEAELIALGITE